MTDADITLLRRTVQASSPETGEICWSPDEYTARKVIGIGRPLTTGGLFEDEPEPSECAFFANGEYVALYNTELDDFAVVKRFSLCHCQPTRF
ncbi:hypothetical protein OpiT1DRAFT_05661 [Opitutaceae bacterium TAV1]|nr:hypothetical protein OpiT1DRAFT_05661 [Opitutaceae bacterium TAV1]